VALASFNPLGLAQAQALEALAAREKAETAVLIPLEELKGAEEAEKEEDQLALAALAEPGWRLLKGFKKAGEALEAVKGLGFSATMIVFNPEDPYPDAELQLLKEKAAAGQGSELILGLEGEDLKEEEERIRQGLSFRLAKSSLDYLISHGMYFVKKTVPFYKPTRYAHALRVAELAFAIAQANRLSPGEQFKAYQAGYFHDLTRAGAKERYNKAAAELYGNLFQDGLIPAWALHQFTAPMVLKEEFGLTDEEVLTAIRYHSTGHREMSPLDKILYASDKIEPGRHYDSGEMIAKMKEDYVSGFQEVLQTNTDYLKSTIGPAGISDRLTQECMACYLK
jgi:predicted HD superfamily hydrolase involved in NAD metabolism